MQRTSFEWERIRLVAVTLSIALMVAIGIASLLGAHLQSGEVFVIRFDQLGGREIPWTGFTIEVLRLVLAVCLSAIALLVGFRRHVFEVFGLAGEQRSMRLTVISRIAFVVCAMLISFGELRKLYSTAIDSYSSECMSWAFQHNNVNEDELAAEFESLRKSYAWYSGYSAVFYGILVPLLVVIPGKALFEDVPTLWRNRRKVSESDTVGDRVVRLKEYRKGIQNGTKRYIDLLGAVALFHVFQVLIGDLTLSDSAQSASRFGAGLCAVSVTIVLFVWVVYFSTYRDVVDRMENTEIRKADILSPTDFLKDLLRGRLSGYAILAALIVSAPLEAVFGRALRILSGI